MQKYKYIISLGASCAVASGLKTEGVRDASYPFDWIISSVEGMEKAILSRFDGWLEYAHLKQSKTLSTAYYDEVYKVKFFHDFAGT